MTTKTGVSISILIILFLCVAWAPFGHATDAAWTPKAPMQEARSGLGIAVVNGKIYAIGGAGSTGFSSTNEEYDPATNTWISKAPMPTPRSAFGIAVYGNKIYCIGGYTNSSSPATAVNQVYDPITNTWAIKSSMPTARLNLRANVIGGKIYVIGGIPYPDTGRTLNEVYDPSSDSWTTKAPVPIGVDSYGSATIGSKIYIMKSGLNQIYDAENDRWSSGVAPPLSSFTASAAVLATANSSERIFLFGADAGGPYWMLNYTGFTTQSYDPATDNWTVWSSMPTGRFDAGVASANDRLYVIGGFNYGEHISIIQQKTVFSTANEQYTPALDVAHPTTPTQSSVPTPTQTTNPTPTSSQTSKPSPSPTPATLGKVQGQWTQKAPMHNPRYDAGIAVVNGTIYVMGGRYTQQTGNTFTTVATATMEAYDTATDTWTEKAPMPSPMDSFGVAVYQNRIYAIGGSVNFEYDPATDTWTNRTPMPVPRTNLHANIVGGKIYLVGGKAQNFASSVNEAYDPATDSWTTFSSIPTGVGSYASEVVNGKIFIISGATGSFGIGSATNLTQVYDPAVDMWDSAASIPISASSSAAVATTIKHGTTTAIYVINGAKSSNPLVAQALTQVYFPANNSWSQGVAMPVDRAGQSVAIVNGTIYAIGGGHNIFTPDTTENWQYMPADNELTTSPSLSSSPDLTPTVAPTSSIPEFPAWILLLPCLFMILVLNKIGKTKKDRKILGVDLPIAEMGITLGWSQCLY